MYRANIRRDAPLLAGLGPSEMGPPRVVGCTHALTFLSDFDLHIFFQRYALFDGLVFLPGVVRDSMPSESLILEPHKVLAPHTPDHPSQRGALDCSPVGRLLEYEVLVANDVSFL